MYPTLKIPKHGIVFDDGFSDNEDDEDNDNDEDEDEESIFLNPEMTPQEIKTMRLKKFSLNYQRSLSTNITPHTSPQYDSHQTLQNSIEKNLHVGVHLLDDDDDEDDNDDNESEDNSNSSDDDGILPFSPVKLQQNNKNNSSFHQNLGSLNSPSATAWMNST